jgi:hypothetical protein
MDKLKPCPFCGEDDFDLIGLKHHLLKFCDVFRETKSFEEDILQKRRGSEKNNR